MWNGIMNCTKFAFWILEEQFSFGWPLTLKVGVGSIPYVIANEKEHKDPLFSLQFSQEGGLILIHNEYKKKLTIISASITRFVLIAKLGNINGVPVNKGQFGYKFTI